MTTEMILDVAPDGSDYRLVLAADCRDCSGTGLVQSSEWARWLRRFEHEETRLKAVRPALDRGAIVDGAVAFAGEEPTEPEEVECVECEGRGLKATEAGMTILSLVRAFS